jgi:hypothetical protein
VKLFVDAASETGATRLYERVRMSPGNRNRVAHLPEPGPGVVVNVSEPTCPAYAGLSQPV